MSIHKGREDAGVSQQTRKHPLVAMVGDVRSDELERRVQSLARQQHMTQEGWMELLDATIPKLKVTLSSYVPVCNSSLSAPPACCHLWLMLPRLFCYRSRWSAFE